MKDYITICEYIPDSNMTRRGAISFLRQLEIPEPYINLGCGGGSHAQQTAAIMERALRNRYFENYR